MRSEMRGEELRRGNPNDEPVPKNGEKEKEKENVNQMKYEWKFLSLSQYNLFQIISLCVWMCVRTVFIPKKKERGNSNKEKVTLSHNGMTIGILYLCLSLCESVMWQMTEHFHFINSLSLHSP